MSNPFQADTSQAASDLELELLQDLERQSFDQIKRLRVHDRLEVRLDVVIEPANSSRLGEFRIQAATVDLSQGGCKILTPRTLNVGDVYRLSFEPGQIDLPLVFARCLRCRLLREDSFETGFGFFTPIALGAPELRSEDLLG